MGSGIKTVSIAAIIVAVHLCTVSSEPFFRSQEDILRWEAPRQLQIRFPYYVSGYTEDGSPVHILEFGKWDIASLIADSAYAPGLMEQLDMYISQLYLRLLSDGKDSKPSAGTVVIADAKGFSSNQTANPEVLHFLLKQVSKFNELKKSPMFKMDYVINANKAFWDYFEKTKLVLESDKVEVYGENPAEWSPELLKYLGLDQTRIGVAKVSPLRQLLEWGAPDDFHQKFPYYFLGFSRKGSPVYLAHFGHWDQRSEVRKGPEATQQLYRYMYQFMLRMYIHGIETPGSPGSILIADQNGYTTEQTRDPKTRFYLTTVLRRSDKMFRGPGIAQIFIVNNNENSQELLAYHYPFPSIGTKVKVYDVNDKEAMVSALLQEIQPDQLLEPYGGTKKV